MKILVLAGGLSPERDVSLVSASKIAKALINKGHRVFVLDLYYGISDVKLAHFTLDADKIKAYSVSENAPEIKKCGNRESGIGKNVIECCKTADVVFMALHGDIGENGRVQALLDMNGIKYTGSGYEGCLLSMNKNISKALVSAHHIKTAEWCVNENDNSIGFPCVVKPVSGGSSIGVSIVENQAQFNSAVHLAKQYDCDVLIEKEINGREFSVGILNNMPLPVIEIKPKNDSFYDYRNKYQPGNTAEICPADIPFGLTQQLQKTAQEIHNILNLKFYSRIDFMVDLENNIYFLEANSLPGMTPASLLPQEAEAAGISYDDLCSMIAQSVF